MIRFLAPFVGVTIGEFLVVRKRRQRLRSTGDSYAAGRSVIVHASVHGFTPYFMSSWVGGELEIQQGVVDWHPGFYRNGLGQRIVAGEMTGIGLRSPTSRESWAVTPECVVLTGEMGDHRIDISVLQDDLPIVIDALRLNRLLD